MKDLKAIALQKSNYLFTTRISGNIIDTNSSLNIGDIWSIDLTPFTRGINNIQKVSDDLFNENLKIEFDGFFVVLAHWYSELVVSSININ